MIVIISSRPATRCSSASSQPKKMIHTTLPITDQMPELRRQVVVRPNGQTTKLASRKEAMPKGMVTMSTNASRPARTYPMASQSPASTSHRMLPITLMGTTPAEEGCRQQPWRRMASGVGGQPDGQG